MGGKLEKQTPITAAAAIRKSLCRHLFYLKEINTCLLAASGWKILYCCRLLKEEPSVLSRPFLRAANIQLPPTTTEGWLPNLWERKIRTAALMGPILKRLSIRLCSRSFGFALRAPVFQVDTNLAARNNSNNNNNISSSREADQTAMGANLTHDKTTPLLT